MKVLETMTAPTIRTQTSVVDGVTMTETHSNGNLVAFSLQRMPTVADVLKQRPGWMTMEEALKGAGPCECDICRDADDWGHRQAVRS